jgi:molybdenum cofactor cytidylyltransferase
MVTAVILAAGESARLGRPKQLVEYGSKTLIAHAIGTAQLSSCDEIIVVVGAHADLIRREIESYPVKIVENPNWNEGKASSIRAAVNAVSHQPEVSSGILFLTCDQPGVPWELLNELVDHFRLSYEAPVACAYAATIGIPAVIPRRLFQQLLRLRDDHGAQMILKTVCEEVITVPFMTGSFDIDSEEDLRQWQNGGNFTATD